MMLHHHDCPLFIIIHPVTDVHVMQARNYGGEALLGKCVGHSFKLLGIV